LKCAITPMLSQRIWGADHMLKIENLTSHYGRIQALHGVDVEVNDGELVALVGGNGAGKTTLLRTISGLQEASGGTVTFEGQDITSMAAEKRVRLEIAQVPEGRQVFTALSVEDNIRLGAFTKSDKGEISADLEQMYGRFPILKEKRNQSAGTLSGGQQQMLAMARALMSRPRLLLLDEPSMGLSPVLVMEIFSIIEELKEQGVTIFLVEQNATAALRVADRGYVMETGKILLTGSGESLLNDETVKAAYLGI
jgi:branched-chain amino acid transport system ATP-binding protein